VHRLIFSALMLLFGPLEGRLDRKSATTTVPRHLHLGTGLACSYLRKMGRLYESESEFRMDIYNWASWQC